MTRDTYIGKIGQCLCRGCKIYPLRLKRNTNWGEESVPSFLHTASHRHTAGFWLFATQFAQCDIDCWVPIPHWELHLLVLLPIQVKRLQTHTMQSSVRLPRKNQPFKPQKKGLYTNSHRLGPLLTQNQESPSPRTWLLIHASLSGSLIQKQLCDCDNPACIPLFWSSTLLHITITCIIQKKKTEFGSQSVTQSL